MADFTLSRSTRVHAAPVIGKLYAVSARWGWATIAKPNSVGSPGAMSCQDAPPSSVT